MRLWERNRRHLVSEPKQIYRSPQQHSTLYTRAHTYTHQRRNIISLHQLITHTSTTLGAAGTKKHRPELRSPAVICISGLRPWFFRAHSFFHTQRLTANAHSADRCTTCSSKVKLNAKFTDARILGMEMERDIFRAIAFQLEISIRERCLLYFLRLTPAYTWLLL